MPSAITNAAAETLTGLIRRAAGEQLLEKAVFSKPHDPAVVRVTLTLRCMKHTVVVQAETLRAADVATVKGKKKPVQAAHENLPTDSDALSGRVAELVADFDQINVMTSVGDCEFRRSKGGKETLIGASPILSALNGSSPAAPRRLPIAGNDKVKNRILCGSEPFLIRLDVSDANGRVHDKKQPKFRQINRFLELIRDVESNLPAEGRLYICDLSCFAVRSLRPDRRCHTIDRRPQSILIKVHSVCEDSARFLLSLQL